LQRGYFKPDAIRSLLHEHYRGYRNRAGAIWLLLVFELWHRNLLEVRGTGYSGFVPEAVAAGHARPVESSM
jgi:hypothetical protein